MTPNSHLSQRLDHLLCCSALYGRLERLKGSSDSSVEPLQHLLLVRVCCRRQLGLKWLKTTGLNLLILCICAIICVAAEDGAEEALGGLEAITWQGSWDAEILDLGSRGSMPKSSNGQHFLIRRYAKNSTKGFSLLLTGFRHSLVKHHPASQLSGMLSNSASLLRDYQLSAASCKDSNLLLN